MDLLVVLHSLLRWLVLIAAVAALVVAALAWLGSSTNDRQGRLATLIFVVALDIQVVLGIAIYLAGNYFQFANRQLQAEHPIMMLIALIIAHLFAARARRSSGLSAARLRSIGIATSLLFLLVGIPWVRR